MGSSVIGVVVLCVIGLTLECAADTLRFNSLSLVQDIQFSRWAKQYGKRYGTVEEFQARFAIFRESAKLVQQHNKKGLSYKLELNKFADMSHDEFSQLYLLNTPQNCSATRSKDRKPTARPSMIPRSIDWRKRGVVSGVKNQGQCGSCWTFSTTGCMESHMAIQYGRMYNLSEQQLVDCAQAFNNKGCSGGLPSQAFEYIHYNPGLMQEKDYPYTAKDGPCVFRSDKAVAFVKEIHNITQNDEAGLQVAVGTVGPVSIAFQVASDFRLYKSGVYKSTVCLSDPAHVNHAVLVVGYDTTESGEPYWIVKNSWGPTWGVDGYFNIYRGKNMCGLADCASYPITAQNPTVK